MKPTKKIEATVLDVYHKWLHSYLNGDVKTYDSYFDNSFHFIGSTNNEEFLTRKDTTNFFKATAEQLAGKTQLRNETKIVEQFGELVFVTHLFDAWFLNGNDWSFYGRFRFSNILEQNEDGWHFVYQHYSTPDSKAQDGETIGFNQITKENLELREAIQRRTVELEEKNKELEIEGSLERIRAKALAMTSSEDLLDVVVTLRTEFLKLGHEAQYFWHMMWLPDKYEKAMTSGDGTRIGMVMELPRHIHGKIPLLANWEKSTDPMVIYSMDTVAAIDYVDKMITLGDFKQVDPQAPTHDDIRHIGGLTFIMARTTQGEIGYSLPGVVENPPKEDLEILVKFAGAFDLAHRRFLDLQKAEKQRREVEIALALEKVRSRTMAMHKSEELADLSLELVKQVQNLGVATWFCAFNIYDEDQSGSLEWGSNGQGTFPKYRTPREGIFLRYYKAGKKGETLLINEIEENECATHYEYLCTLSGVGEQLLKMKDAGIPFPKSQIDHVAYFKYGYVLFITYDPVPESHDIFKRFANVFEQTYTRFLDLKKAEAQAKEAQIEAALEKVRSRSLEMSESSEMQNVANEILKQLRAVGLKIDALAMSGVIDNDSDYDVWVGGANSKKPLRIPYNNETQVQREFNKAIKERPEFFAKTYTGKVMKDYFKALMGTGNSFNPEIVAFMKTCTGFTTTLSFMKNSGIQLIRYSEEAFSKEDNAVIVRFGKVFEQAYIRFLDLQKAEEQTILAQQNLIKLQAQKQRAEEALSELQQTQTQLIQSEKMASLGELTAGIAHEIQNPLNFVNNFSEVSKELLEEMQVEIENEDFEEVKAIMADVIQNLEKINHHGKRADAIVKGMLQHSRSSSGTKEPTDINALADEYLRLAYHGLRAKDKSFNATLETDFDKHIGKVNIMPQDMGRVILNLITNAFYAVNEKKQQKPKDYKPTVTVSTKRVGDKIEIKVTDNGNGIPKQVIDKVFQPFFTTKPTGQGTGLGLSMSYDIITKGHGGELHVETIENEGTQFNITLPV